MLAARSGDPAGGRAAAAQSRAWFAENDDMIGLSAAELSLANVALVRRRSGGRPRPPRGRGLGVRRVSSPHHQEGWVLAVLAAICAEDGEATTARRWLDRASRHFELLGGDAGMAYCRGGGARAGVADGERDQPSNPT